MNAQHTPGPSGRTPLNWIVVNPDGKLLAILDSESEAYFFTKNRGHAEGAKYSTTSLNYAAAPELLEAIQIAHDCGHPSKVPLLDNEGIEGWRWSHPDGREWEKAGDWSEPAPMHPLASAAIAKAKGKQ